MMNQPTKKSALSTLLGLPALAVVFACLLVLQTASCKPGRQQEGEIPGDTIAPPSETYIDEAAAQLPGQPQQQPADEDRVFVVVEEQAQFPGGEEARLSFLQTNLRYPAKARAAGIQGIVFVSFVVEKDGSITNPHILRGIGHGCDEEVIRIVEAMPNWIPARHRGQAVRVQFTMPVRFVLN